MNAAMRVSQLRKMKRFYGLCVALFIVIALGFVFIEALLLSHPAIRVALAIAAFGCLYMYLCYRDFAAKIKQVRYRNDEGLG